jgi:hypothetical protein
MDNCSFQRRGVAPGADKGAVSRGFAPLACAPPALVLARATPILADGQGFSRADPPMERELSVFSTQVLEDIQNFSVLMIGLIEDWHRQDFERVVKPRIFIRPLTHIAQIAR